VHAKLNQIREYLECANNARLRSSSKKYKSHWNLA